MTLLVHCKTGTKILVLDTGYNYWMQGKHGKEKEIACLHNCARSPLLTKYEYNIALQE